MISKAARYASVFANETRPDRTEDQPKTDGSKAPNPPGKADEPYPYPVKDPVPADGPGSRPVPVDEPAAPIGGGSQNAVSNKMKPRVSEFFSMTDRSTLGYIPQAV